MPYGGTPYGGGVLGGASVGPSPIPGIARGMPRRRNPVNAPRTWKKSVVQPGHQPYLYRAQDTITFSETTAGPGIVHASDAITFSETTAGPGVVQASDTFASFSDSAKNSAYHAHAPTADALTFTDSAGYVPGIQNVPSLYKLMPGIGARATPRTRNPVNHPRTFGTTRVHQPEQLSYGAYDTFAFSDAATRSTVTYSKTGTDSLTFTDSAAMTMATADALTFSDAATFTRPLQNANDSLTFSDSASRQANFARTSSDALTFSDAAVGKTGYARTSSDSLSFADAVRFGLAGVDSLTFSDVATRSVMHYTATGSDAFTFLDSAVGPTGHNTRTSSDTLHFFDRPVSFTFDALVFSDSAAAGPVFMAGTDAFSFSDTATASGFVTNVRVYQTYLETLITPSDTRGLVYQMGLETTVKPHSTAHILKAGEEVVVGRIYGQIWPIGWGQVSGRGKGRYGQLWPRWSRDYTGGIGND